MTMRSPRLLHTGLWRGLAVLSLALLSAAPDAQTWRPLYAHAPAAAASGARGPAAFALTGASPARPLANPHGDIDIACEACHTPEAWTPLREDPDWTHERDSDYPLEARHAQAECASCHLDLRFDGLEAAVTDCASCHLDVHRGALGETCQTCHEPTDWALVDGVEVHAQTAFPLTGSHLQVSCETCHDGGAGGAAFSPLPSDCLACHRDALASTETSLVPHVASGFPTDCAACHTTVVWSAGPFDHASASGGFSLVGAHEPLACSSCHAATPDFEPLFAAAGQDDCLSCHEADRANAVLDHSGFPETCTQCHTTSAWEGATADHVTLSGGFALVGSHIDLDCSACHAADLTPIWTPATQNDCVACHQSDYDATAGGIIDHVAAAFPTTCTECHGTDEWQSATFDHAGASGGFTLVGAHEPLACASCHSETGGGLPWDPQDQNDCVSCHASDAAAATPDHTAFPSTCTTCHSPEAWPGATADHDLLSGGFSLVGAHASIACESCHSGASGEVPWMPASQDDCVSCHASDAASALPDHTTFPETCATCHTPEAWPGATVDHVSLSGGFSLVGAHVTLACESCHSGASGEVPWMPASQDDCQSCHTEDAAAATPDHTGFPTTCTECHSVDQWQGAQIDHPQFPIFSGRHAGEWDSCQTCHVQPNDFAVFSCLTCHEHNQADMDDEHDGVGGYVYQSEACYSCHPNGEEDLGSPIRRTRRFGLIRR